MPSLTFRPIRLFAALTGVFTLVMLVSLAGAARAQELDFHEFYWARTTLGTSDNDIIGVQVGLTWRGTQWDTRVSVLGGLRNEDWTGVYPPLAGATVQRFRTQGEVITGWGGALNWADDRAVTLDAAWGRQAFRDRSAWRTTFGLGGVAGSVPGRADLSPFAVVEKTWYPRKWAALSLGAQADDRGGLLAVRTEARLTRMMTLALEWTYTDAYYDFNGPYFSNDIKGGLFLTQPFDSLRARDKALPVRLTHRWAEIQ